MQMIKTHAEVATESPTVNSRFRAKYVTSGGMLSAQKQCLAKLRSN